VEIILLACETLPWADIDTVLLDMDGTLLDLHFDSFFWLEHLPIRYAQIHQCDFAETKVSLLAQLSKNKGTIEWYSVDYWSDKLKLDIAELRAEVAHNISYRPFVKDFLRLLSESSKRVVLVTNDHRSGLEMKLRVTGLADYLDKIIVSHDYSVAKEEQAFWHKMQEDEAFDPKRALFIDDTVAVLDSAALYGIGHLRYIPQPNSQQTREHCAKYSGIHCFSKINQQLLSSWSEDE
jgi:putative hydrolase of the HAD superfamily